MKRRRSSSTPSLHTPLQTHAHLKSPSQSLQQPLPTVQRSPTPNEKSDKPEIKLQIKRALNRYNATDRVPKDYRDTIAQMAYICSNDLARSLAVWHRLRDQRTNQKSIGVNGQHDKIWDPTACTFTLWPLTLDICPKPEWSIEEELESIAIRSCPLAYQLKKLDQQTNPNSTDDDDHLSDVDLDKVQLENLAAETRQTLEYLLLKLHSVTPPPKKKKRSRQKELLDETRRTEPQSNINPSAPDLDPGIKWNDILVIAADLNIDQEVLKRTNDRLKIIYASEAVSSSKQQDTANNSIMSPLAGQSLELIST